VPYYNYYIRNSSTMNNNNSIKNLDMLEILEDIKKYATKNKLYDENVIKYLIFDHVLITTINRVALQKNADVKMVIANLREYCHDNISNYKKLPFYKNISKKRKIIANLNYCGFHYLSKLLLIINAKFGKGSYGKTRTNKSK